MNLDDKKLSPEVVAELEAIASTHARIECHSWKVLALIARVRRLKVLAKDACETGASGLLPAADRRERLAAIAAEVDRG